MSVVAIVVAVSALVCAVSAVRVGAKPSNCDVCQAVADAAHIIALYEGWNATQLENELAVVCTVVPQTYQPQCKLLVQTFGTVECQCITAPSSSFNATECCADVALCGDDKANLSLQRLVRPPLSKSKPVVGDSSLQCSACKAVANLAHLAAEFTGLSGSQLDTYVASLCDAVPTEYQSECASVVQVGGLKVAQCVANATTFSAQACCSEVSLCDAPSQAHINALLGLQ